MPRPITHHNTLTKDGLTGVSGTGVDGSTMFHIAANYAAKTQRGPAMCFVEWCERGNPVPTWKRMTVKRARREGRRIVECAHGKPMEDLPPPKDDPCHRPAISLDHYWPYYSDGCYCEKHREAVRGRFKQ